MGRPGYARRRRYGSGSMSAVVRGRGRCVRCVVGARNAGYQLLRCFLIVPLPKRAACQILHVKGVCPRKEAGDS